MEFIRLFTDGSVDTKSKIGYGAYFIVNVEKVNLDSLDVQIKRFDNTSSTKIEIETLLWALNELKNADKKILVYTDSQNIIGLPGRRIKLEQNNYKSKNNKLLNNYKLYQEFYKITDLLNCEFIKVKGHQRSKQKNIIEKYFSVVDKASRKALRNDKFML